MKDTAIEKMFARYQPDLGDSKEYMDALTKKLEAVEYVKRYQEEQARRSRKMLVVVFAMGVVTGSIGILLTLMHPFWSLSPVRISVPVLQNPIHIPNVGFLLCLCLVGLGVTGLVVKWMELRHSEGIPSK